MVTGRLCTGTATVGPNRPTGPKPKDRTNPVGRTDRPKNAGSVVRGDVPSRRRASVRGVSGTQHCRVGSELVSTFVLVHGAWHGAWCWERLVPELEARGHASIAMDLP